MPVAGRPCACGMTFAAFSPSRPLRESVCSRTETYHHAFAGVFCACGFDDVPSTGYVVTVALAAGHHNQCGSLFVSAVLMLPLLSSSSSSSSTCSLVDIVGSFTLQPQLLKPILPGTACAPLLQGTFATECLRDSVHKEKGSMDLVLPVPILATPPAADEETFWEMGG